MVILRRSPISMKEKLKRLADSLEGELFFDKTMRTLYATDASAYRELPLAVAIPKTEKDIERLIKKSVPVKNWDGATTVHQTVDRKTSTSNQSRISPAKKLVIQKREMAIG